MGNKNLQVTIHILPNILRSKENQTMKFSHLTEYIVRIVFFQNHAENEQDTLSQDFFLFLENLMMR